MPTPGPSQAAYTQLEKIRGWFQITALVFSSKMSADVTFNPPAGRCVSLNSAGEFVTGCLGRQMPMFLDTSAGAADVLDADAGEDYVVGKPTGELTALVAKGAYELGTTEYDAGQEYVPNEFLRGINADTNATTGGRLTNQGVVYTSATPVNTTAVVGRVSVPPAKRASDRKPLLRFWPASDLPGAAGL